MEIWPAIDLLGGKCVRLQQGDYSRNTVFSDSPADVATRWFAAGSQFLHCVDLDGAKTGSIVNEHAILSIVSVAENRIVQLGGGVRTEAMIERLLNLGLSRLVVGTAALKDPAWFAKMCEEYPGHLVLGLDALNGMVATEGWLENSQTSASELVDRSETFAKECVERSEGNPLYLVQLLLNARDSDAFQLPGTFLTWVNPCRWSRLAARLAR